MSEISNFTAGAKPFPMLSLGQMFDAPEPEIEYLVDEMLPMAGMSVLIAKPKDGKSTLARQGVVAVAQGKPFLCRNVMPGAVLYFALEEKQSEVLAHLRDLGATPTDPISCYFSMVPQSDPLPHLEATIRTTPNVKLVVIDPVFRFLRVGDSSDYVKVNDKMEPLLAIARDCNVHILIVHHMKKRQTDDTIDGTLGSTAINAVVDTIMALTSSSKGVRTLETRQRYGRSLEPTILTWDQTTRSVSLGLTTSLASDHEEESQRQRLENQMTAFIAENPHMTREAVFEAVPARTSTQKYAIKRLLEADVLTRHGAGTKSHPFTYTIKEVVTEQ